MGGILPFQFSKSVVRGPSSSCHFHILGDRVGRYRSDYLLYITFVFLLLENMASVPTGKAKMESRLLGICMANNVDEDLMDLMGENGLCTCTQFKHIVSGDAALREMLKLEPFKLDKPDFQTMRKVGSICAVYEQCQVVVEVTVKADEDRLRQNLPPEISEENYELALKLFTDQNGGVELERHLTPSKGFFERMCHQVLTRFDVISYRTVTNRTQDDINQPRTMLSLDPTSGAFRNTTQDYTIPVPTNSEAYRNRLKVLATCYVLAKLKFPVKPQLRTADIAVVTRYQEWLFGENVWGMAQTDHEGRPISTPSLRHVMHYDEKIRKKMSTLMNEGMDFQSALTAAQKHEETRTVHFISPVSRDINTPECRACSAPGLREAFGLNPTPRQSAQPAGEQGISKKDLQKLKREVRAELEADLKRKWNQGALPPPQPHAEQSKRQKRRQQQQANKQLALQNGGVGDGTGNGAAGSLGGGGPGAGKGGKKGKGKGKGKGTKTGDGTPICFNYNKGTACRNTPCTMAHVCLKCHATDHRECDNRC